jgi:hypothetical protein
MEANCDELVVSHSWEVQEKVRALLDALHVDHANITTSPPGPVSATPFEPTEAAERALHAHLPKVKTAGTLEEVVTMLRRLSQGNIVIDKASLNLADPGTSWIPGISLDLKDVTLHEALSDLVSQVSIGFEQRNTPCQARPPYPQTAFGFCARGDYILIGCFDLRFGGGMTGTCVYDVNDLLPPSPAEQGSSAPASPPGQELPDTDRLSHFTHEVLGLDWNIAADSAAECVLSYEGRLVVTQTFENQRKLADRLAAVRARAAKLTPGGVLAAPATSPGAGAQP